MVKYTGRGLVVAKLKRPGVLSKVQMLTLVLGVGVFSLLPREISLRGQGDFNAILINFSANFVQKLKGRWVVSTKFAH